MIALFWYDQDAPCSHLKLELHWQAGKPAARIIAPSEIIERYSDTLGLRRNDEIIRLEMALGYSVIIAAFAEMDLTITGDRSAWPDCFGELRSRPAGESRFH